MHEAIDPHSLLFSGTASGSGLFRFSRFFGLIRMFSDNSQSIRYSLLWLNRKPFMLRRVKKHRPTPRLR
ncbi:hypothetical protein EPYR_01400 [Erwinia pyrifoliae DSM 12163]|nr:hypothetical protein EPYR_01400 [Erwinia pyrifoliae DSM 12163]